MSADILLGNFGSEGKQYADADGACGMPDPDKVLFGARMMAKLPHGWYLSRTAGLRTYQGEIIDALDALPQITSPTHVKYHGVRTCSMSRPLSQQRAAVSIRAIAAASNKPVKRVLKC